MTLGYEQLSPILYSKAQQGWFDTFNLQKSQGSDFFYVNYGVTIPNLCPVGEDFSIHSCGNLIGARLRTANGSSGFPCGTKHEVEISAAEVLSQYQQEALPWLESMRSWSSIAAEYLRVNRIYESKIGTHSSGYGEGYRSATYAYLLLKGDQDRDAVRWLKEAERILSLVNYITQDGRIVHEKEKYARLQKPDNHDLETLDNVRKTLRKINGI